MFKLLKGGHCFSPDDIGKKDILVVGNTIYKVEDEIQPNGLWDIEILDCTGRIVCPALIDQHVHITGGGGEEGPISRVPEIAFGDIAMAGVGTVVGVLGVDSITRNISGLLAKARALEKEGISTYIYAGSYGVPTATLTGKAITDVSLIDKVIGIGEIAISDYRSSHASTEALRELAWEAKVGGMIGDKAGVMHIHVGDGREGLEPLLKLLAESEFPIDMFVPTHINRNKKLFEQAMEYVRNGGNIDLTAGEKTGKGYSVPDAVEILLKANLSTEKVTISSDGNGSMPLPDGSSGVGKVTQLYDDIRGCILDKKINTDLVLKMVTSNVAKVLKLYPQKGAINPGSDADILILNEGDLSINGFITRGKTIISNGNLVQKGKFEK
ncbi:MAG: beta-aspartyl-peptidase [Clostridia bacterium]|nr:beta-aspartyl-peptidase [Clostridia bacterium]